MRGFLDLRPSERVQRIADAATDPFQRIRISDLAHDVAENERELARLRELEVLARARGFSWRDGAWYDSRSCAGS